MQVCPQLIHALDALRLNLTHFYLLEAASLGQYDNCSVIHSQTLIRKGWMRDEKLTPSGQEVYKALKDASEGKKPRKKREVKPKVVEGERADFERWWAAFPSTTGWYDERTNREFEGGRPLRVLKEECFKKFNAIIASGYTVDKLIELLKLEIAARHKESLQSGDNKMRYMHGTAPYLNQKDFQAWEGQLEETTRVKAIIQKKKDDALSSESTMFL